MKKDQGPVETFLTFGVARVRLAVPARFVEEVCAGLHSTPLPLSPEHIPGVVILRGSPVPLLNLQRFLDLSKEPERAGSQPDERKELFHDRIAIVNAAEMRVGIICDQVFGLRQFGLHQVRETQIAKGRRLLEFVSGEIENENDVLLLLDLPRLLQEARVQK